MKSITIKAIAFLLFVSCNNNRANDRNNPEIPVALQEKSRAKEIVYSKRTSNNLVEQLYDELIQKDSGLNRLESTIEQLYNSKRDSTKYFDKFNSSNQNYYNSADQYIVSVKDSTLRTKLKNVIAGKLVEYNTSVSKHQDIIKLIEKNEISISDLHIVLKILETSTMMEKFQKDNKPDISTLSNYVQEQNVAIRKLDSLTKL